MTRTWPSGVFEREGAYLPFHWPGLNGNVDSLWGAQDRLSSTPSECARYEWMVLSRPAANWTPGFATSSAARDSEEWLSRPAEIVAKQLVHWAAQARRGWCNSPLILYSIAGAGGRSYVERGKVAPTNPESARCCFPSCHPDLATHSYSNPSLQSSHLRQ